MTKQFEMGRGTHTGGPFTRGGRNKHDSKNDEQRNRWRVRGSTGRSYCPGRESNSLREKLKSLIAEGKKKIVLNMANVKYIDSSGLGTLVAAYLNAKNQAASVRLCHLGRKFHEVLQMTKLLTVFDVYDTEAAAVSSFQSSLAASS